MKVVEGVKISGYGHQELALDLETYCRLSPVALEHVRKAGVAGVTIEVQQRGRICCAEGTVVRISRDACLNAASGLTSPIYMVESVLFELQNALNSQQFGRLRRDARSGQLSLLQYGLGMATLEYESTAKVVAILAQVKGAGKPVSPWGEKQFAGYAMGPRNFANQPHDPQSAGEQRLPSGLFYTYSYLQDTVKSVGNMKLELKNLATISKGTRALDAREWGATLVPKWVRYGTPAQFLVHFVDALLWLGNETGWSVSWRGGTQADWKLCTMEFVRAVPILRHDEQTAKAVKQDIQGAKFA